MLSSFTVSNYKSFDTAQCLTMHAGKIRSNVDRIFTLKGFRLLKFLAIYGANASGKSTLVNALRFAQDIILNGLPVDCGNDYCRVKEENRNNPSVFTFEFTFEDKIYNYGFEVILSEGKFISEHLWEINRTLGHKVIFFRDIVRGMYNVDSYFKGKEANDRLRIYAEDICKDDTALLLQQMNQNKNNLYASFQELSIYRRIYQWFKFKLSVNYPDRPITNYSYITNERNIAQINSLLNEFGTGISEFKIVEVSLDKVTARIPKDLYEHIIETLSEQKKHNEKVEPLSIPSVMIRSTDNSMFIIQSTDNGYICKTIEFVHHGCSSLFSLSEESDGTIRLLDLIEVLLCDDSEQVYVIDEINRRFHPLLTRKFIEEYLKLAVKRNIQLIVTTHESELMSFDLLRKDEIAFVSKNDLGTSNYYSMENFDARFDKRVRNAYLHGDYGAIPIFKKSTVTSSEQKAVSAEFTKLKRTSKGGK